MTIYWAFTDAGSWLLDGVAHLRVLNIIDNTILFLCTPLSAFCFWKYLTGQVTMHRKFELFLDKWLWYIVLISVVLRVVNLFNGMYFSVDAAGVYQRGPLYPVSMLSAILTLAAVTCVENMSTRRRSGNSRRKSMKAGKSRITWSPRSRTAH